MLEENSGIQTQLESKDIEEYTSLVLQERQKFLEETKTLAMTHQIDSISVYFRPR